MGSGKYLNNAKEKYGIENFKKEILQTFDNQEDMFKAESQVVNEEFVDRDDTYNIKTGGTGRWSHLKGTVQVKDVNGNIFRVSNTDPRFLSKELKSVSFTNSLVVKDINGNRSVVSKNYPRYLSGELVSCVKGTITVKDINGTLSRVSVNDPRYLSGELKFIWCGKNTQVNSRRE